MHHEIGQTAAVDGAADARLPVIKRQIEADSFKVRDFLTETCGQLKSFGLGDEECGTVELVLAEALNNIVEHAYQENGGLVEIELTPFADGLHCLLCDNGLELPDNALPFGGQAGTLPEADDMPEGGFGWFLIGNLARDLSYRRENQENQLRFRIAVSTGGGEI